MSRAWKTLLQEEAYIHSSLCSWFVEFDSEEDRDHIFHYDPWFLGQTALCKKDWFPTFNPSTDVLSSAPIRVRLPNLPLQFWGAEPILVSEMLWEGLVKDI